MLAPNCELAQIAPDKFTVSALHRERVEIETVCEQVTVRGRALELERARLLGLLDEPATGEREDLELHLDDARALGSEVDNLECRKGFVAKP